MTKLPSTALAGALILSGALLLGLAGAAVAAEPMKMDHGAMMSPPAPALTPADQAYAKANGDMMAGMDVKPSGDADRDFVAMMLPHHMGAVDMARVELQYGRDPKLRAMAADVVKAQEAEIAEMRTWQAQHPK